MADRVRRLDHVAIVVRDTAAAIATFGDWLGLRVAHSEELAEPHVRLTYLDCGNCYVQLVEPLAEDSAAAAFLREHGEGLHHICFGVDDVEATAHALAGPPAARASGRGRPSAFVGDVRHGVTVELTRFEREQDVGAGWLS